MPRRHYLISLSLFFTATVALAFLAFAPTARAQISTLDAFVGPLVLTDELVVNDYSESPITRRIDARELFGPFAGAPTWSVDFDAATWSAALDATSAPVWANITSTPTTLAGYGITDAASSAQGALADTAVQPSTAPVLDATNFTNLPATGLQVGDNVSDLTNDAGYLDATTGYTQAAADAAFADAAQGALADTSTQPGDNVSDLTNDAGYLDATTGYTQAAADAAFEPAGVTAADITDGTATGQAAITAADAAALATAAGLGNVDNTADADKPVSTATQTALDGKEDAVSRVGFAAKESSTSISATTWTTIAFATEIKDTDSAWDGSVFTVPAGEGGMYEISGVFTFSSVTDGNIYIVGLNVNDTATVTDLIGRGTAGATALAGAGGAMRMELSAGDTLEMRVLCGNATSAYGTVAGYCSFSAYKMHP